MQPRPRVQRDVKGSPSTCFRTRVTEMASSRSWLHVMRGFVGSSRNGHGIALLVLLYYYSYYHHGGQKLTGPNFPLKIIQVST